jgi:hypothetical protein
VPDERRTRIRRRIGWIAPLGPHVKDPVCEIDSYHLPVSLGSLGDQVAVPVIVALETVSFGFGVVTSHRRLLLIGRGS